MKMKLFSILTGVACLHVLLLAGICISGGCRGPKVLQNRSFIPAPETEPVPDAQMPTEVIAVEKETVITDLPPLEPVAVESIKYQVQKGDSFWKIARKYGVSMNELIAYNKIPAKKPLKVGTTLLIPPGGKLVSESSKPVSRKAATTSKAPARREPLPAGGNYTVKSGDSLWKIAVRHNLKTSTLIKANGLDPKKSLKVGQKLIIPGGMDKVEETPAGAVDKPEKNTDDVMDIKDESLPEDTLDNNDKSTDNETSAPLDDIKDSSKDEEIPDIDDSGDSVKDILDDGSSTPATAPSQTHKLTSDTTLDQVASQYGITTEELKKANPDLPASGELKSGTEIKIP